MANFFDWLHRDERGSAAILQGGSLRDPLNAVIDGTKSRAVVICDRKLAGALLPVLSLRPGPKIETYLSRGFMKDLSSGLERTLPGVVVVPAEVLESDAAGELKRAHEQILVLAGYPAPPAIVSSIVAHRYVAEIAAYLARKLPPLVIHDRTHWLPQSLIPGVKVFTAADAGRGAADGEEPAATMLAMLEASFEPPQTEALLTHAEYLVRTDLGVLVDMHRWLAGPTADMLLGYWAEQIATAARSPGHELFVEFSRQKLGELSEALKMAESARV